MKIFMTIDNPELRSKLIDMAEHLLPDPPSRKTGLSCYVQEQHNLLHSWMIVC